MEKRHERYFHGIRCFFHWFEQKSWAKQAVTSENRRVVHVVRQLHFGGVERRCDMIAASSHLSSFDHEFLAISHEGDVAKKIRAAGSRVTCLNSTSNIPSILTLWKLFRNIRKLKPCIVHTRGAEANFHGIIAARLAGVRHVVGEEIGIPAHKPKAELVFGLIYRMADAVVAISGAVRDALVSKGEASPEQVTVIYNPTVSPNLDMSRNDFSSIRIGFVGRLEPVKNPLALVEAAVKLIGSGCDIYLDIVGDGSQGKAIEAAIATANVGKRITLHGFQSNPFDLLKHCNLYVQPSITEGFGIAIVEAGLCGLPLLVTRNGGTIELVEHGRNGWLLKGESTDDIVRGIADFIAVPDEEKRKIANVSKQEFAELYTIQKYLRSLDDLYQRLLSEKQS